MHEVCPDRTFQNLRKPTKKCQYMVQNCMKIPRPMFCESLIAECSVGQVDIGSLDSRARQNLTFPNRDEGREEKRKS